MHRVSSVAPAGQWNGATAKDRVTSMPTIASGGASC
jgi:hypothetical protein